MNQKERIDKKLANFVSGMPTEQQKNDAESWTKQSKKITQQLTELLKFWIETTPGPRLIDYKNVRSKVWSSFQNKAACNQFEGRRSAPLGRIWKVAAIIIALILPAFSIIYFINQDPCLQKFTSEGIIEKRNPPNQKAQIQLPDGSKVCLNADSEISFKENFSASIRSIQLTGEAYFEVIDDALHPFEVRTSKLSVSVLRNGFNVSPYHDENDIIVRPLHGPVKAQKNNYGGAEPITLAPGSGFSYSRSIDVFQDCSMQGNDLLYNRLVAGRYGVLASNGRDLQSFIKEISHWYGIQMKTQGDPPKNWRIRATLESEYLNNLLNAISFNEDFSCQLNNIELTLMFS